MLMRIVIMLLAAYLVVPAEGMVPCRISPDESSGGQDVDACETLSAFISRMNSSAAEFSYSYVVKDGQTSVTGEGTVQMQGESYLLKGNGLEVYCDGVTRWTVDRQSLEVVIEPFDSASQDCMENPAVLLRNFDRVFHVDSHTLSGSSYDYLLLPSSSGTDVSSMELGLSTDGMRLLSACLKMKNGATVSISVPSFVFSVFSDTSRFSFDVSTLSGDYVVTDLR